MTTAVTGAAPAKITVNHKVLLISDGPLPVRAWRDILGAAGYQTACTSWEQASAFASAFLPDLIILRPDESGADGHGVGQETCRLLKSKPDLADIPVLFAAANDSKERLLDAFAAGGADCLNEPPDRDVVLARVAAHIRTKVAHQNASQEQEMRHRLHRMETLGTLAGGIAHEFNNLAATVTGYAELALANDHPDALTKSAQMSLESGRRIAEIAKSLERFANPAAGGKLPVDLNNLMNETVDLVHAQLESDGIQLLVKAGDIPRLWLDAGAIREALLNLLTNARQSFGDKKGARQIRLETLQTGDTVYLVVEDSGVGIPPSVLDRVFDPFFTTKGVLAGGHMSCRGLGLSIVAAAMTAHGGSVDIQSEPNRGTHVTLSLPVAQAGTPHTSAKVLVVDDEPVIRSIFSRFITRAGHQLDTAFGGREAIEKIHANHYDIVLLDWMMPEVGGENVLAAARQIAGAPPIVVVTAGYSRELASKAIDGGARECIGKPLNHRKVIYLIEKYAGLHPTPRHGQGTEGQGEIVLVADSHPTIVDLYMLILRRARYEPVVARNGDEILAAVSKEYFDLILVDALMLQKNDVDLIRECKRLNPYTPVLVVGANSADHVIQRSLAAGAAGCIDQPLHLGPFLEKIRAFIEIYKEPSGRPRKG